MTSSLLTGGNSPQTQSFEAGNPTSRVIVSKLTEEISEGSIFSGKKLWAVSCGTNLRYQRIKCGDK